MNITWKKMLTNLRAFWAHMNEGPESDWDKAYLCSVAPISAEALRESMDAGRSHTQPL